MRGLFVYIRYVSVFAVYYITFIFVIQVTLSGKLVVTNLLAECLEFQTVAITDKSTGQKSEGENLIAKAKSTPPSVLLDESCTSALRIRFHGLSSAWSGEIPLRENTKSGQPWLVKVPLQDK